MLEHERDDEDEREAGDCPCDHDHALCGTPILVYLAAPFSHDDPRVEQQRVVMADHVSALMTQLGAFVYSPLNHFAYPAMRKIDAERAYAHGRWMLSRCDAVLVLCTDGWDKSRGVRDEAELAEKLGKPVVLVEPVEDESLTTALTTALNVIMDEVNADV